MPQTVYLWCQTDWQSVNERICCFSTRFVSNYSINTLVQDLWNIFKHECHKHLQQIPSKPSTPSPSQPWISTIKRLSNKKTTGSPYYSASIRLECVQRF